VERATGSGHGQRRPLARTASARAAARRARRSAQRRREASRQRHEAGQAGGALRLAPYAGGHGEGRAGGARVVEVLVCVAKGAAARRGRRAVVWRAGPRGKGGGEGEGEGAGGPREVREARGGGLVQDRAEGAESDGWCARRCQRRAAKLKGLGAGERSSRRACLPCSTLPGGPLTFSRAAQPAGITDVRLAAAHKRHGSPAGTQAACRACARRRLSGLRGRLVR
jgi:hypothetical protein